MILPTLFASETPVPRTKVFWIIVDGILHRYWPELTAGCIVLVLVLAGIIWRFRR